MLIKVMFMKKLLVPALLVMVLSCNSPADKTAVKNDSAGTGKPVYAYSIEKPDNWEMGGTANTVTTLAALKAFENKNLDECMNYFADTVHWRADYIDSKFSKDSLRALFNSFWNGMATLKVVMHDFESVVSKDKKDEYVTVWYKQIATDKNGKIDSAEVVNDFQFVNGKIIALDEALRHFPAPAKN
jgi:hypothetical protein